MAELKTLARPYARAAFEAASAASEVAGWSEALGTFAAIAADSQVKPLLGHPHVAREQLVAMFVAGKPAGASDKVDNFLRILAENRRLGLLPAISAEFDRLKAEAERRQSVVVTSATALDDQRQYAFVTALVTRLGVEVDVSWQVDESLLGGAIVTAGDLVIDGSVRGELDRLRANLSQ